MPIKKKATTVRKSINPKKSSKKTVLHRPVKQINSAKLQSAPLHENVRTYVKNPRLWVGVAVVIIAVLLYLYKGLFVAAVVNGQPIARISVVNQLEQQNGKQVLNNLIAESLVKQEAQKRKIVVSQAEVDSDVKKIEDTLKKQGTTLDAALAARGLTRSQLEDQIKLQKMLDKMVGTTVKVSDADVQAYIDKNQDNLPTNMTDEELKAQVKQQLEQQQIQTKTQAFLADLQKKAQVQYFVNY